MKKILLIASISFVLVSGALAQSSKEKPGCNPSACKPGNTKVAEAKVLTAIRGDLISLNEMWNQKSLGSLDLDLSAAEDDGQSLEKLIVALEIIRKKWGEVSEIELEAVEYPDQLAKRAKVLKDQIAYLEKSISKAR